MAGNVLKRFDAPDEARSFDKGKYEVVTVGGMTIGRATYEPGWKWSKHVGPAVGKALCDVEHIGVVLAGRVKVKTEDGAESELSAGDVFYITPGHDSWVVGEEPYVSLHFMGAETYAKE